MSSTYRDDSVDSMTVRDTIWGGLYNLVGEAVTAAETVIFGLLVLHSSAVLAADAVIDQQTVTCTDSVTVADVVSDALTAWKLVSEKATAADKAITVLQVLSTDTLTVADSVSDAVVGLVSDSVQVADEVTGLRAVSVLVSEQATASDAAPQFASSLIAEALTVGDAVIDAISTSDVCDDTLTGTEAWSGRQIAVTHPPIMEMARAAGARAADFLAARNVVADIALTLDRVSDGMEAGQAWTANSDSWAMSRYAPYAFGQIVVLRGRLYGIGADGVYALDAEGATAVQAQVSTGRVDLGGKLLPTQALLEYSMDAAGTASMAVTTTQNGSVETYSYALARGNGDSMQTGRFEFGRGLRGRHFSFVLKISASQCDVEDLRITSAQSKRRI